MAAASEHNLEIWQHFYTQSFAMSFFIDQQHDLNSYSVKLAKNDRSIPNGGSESDFLVLICEFLNFESVDCKKLVYDASFVKKVFQKTQDGV
jgi:hypothetical protein